MDVLCYAGMEWDHTLWTNRQHVMSRLPHVDPRVRVLYVSPPRFLFSHLASRRLSTTRAIDLRLRAVGNRVWVLQPHLPAPNRIAQRLAPPTLDRHVVRSARRALRELGFGRPCLWAYSPRAEPLADALEPQLIVYDVVDDYPALPGHGHLASADRRLTARADLVFYASARLYEERSPFNPRSHLVGNAADIGLFARARDRLLRVPPQLAALGRPRIVFHGALSAYKLDLHLLRELGRRRPEWTFVLIGPETDSATRRELAGLANVHLLGAAAQEQLPSYLAHVDVAVIPYLRSPYTERLNALKLYEYFAAGVPIVASRLPCFEDFADHVALAEGPAEFEEALIGALAGNALAPPENLSPFSWDAKAERMWELVESSLANRRGTAAEPQLNASLATAGHDR